MNKTDNLMKVCVQLNDPNSFGSESFWIERTGPDTGIVKNVLLFAPIGSGDTVRFIDSDEGFPIVTEVINRTDRVTIAVRVYSKVDTEIGEIEIIDFTKEFFDAATAAGAQVEGFTTGLFGLILPAEIGIDDVDLLDDDTIDEWIGLVVKSVTQPESIDGIDWLYVSTPNDFIGCDTTVINPNPPAVENFTPAVAWNPTEDQGFIDACLHSVDSGEMPGWIRPEDFMELVSVTYQLDSRIQYAISENNYADIVTLCIRQILNAADLPLPPLDRPLFSKKED